MNLPQKLLHQMVRSLLRTVCEVHDEQISKVPSTGPLLIITNHINFLELPTLVTHMGKRPFTGIAKAESWDNIFKKILFDMWGGIPIRRGEADREALYQVLDALKRKMIVGLAPEGTRSHNGCLQYGRPGVLLMALRSRAPILPIAVHGQEHFWENLRKLKRTRIDIEVGNAFHLDADSQPVIREVREGMMREVMFQMAALLPPDNRGMYSDLENATSKYLQFEPGVANNLAGIRYGEC